MKRYSSITIVFLAVFASIGFADPQACTVLNRVVVTGASVSSGFGVSTPPIKGDLGAYRITMKHIVEAMLDCPHEKVALFGGMAFLQNTRANSKAYIEKIIEHKPTLVIGIDFLFWFGHGTPPEQCDIPTYRMEKLNYALKLLDTLKVPVIVGDLPDVSDAVGKMLSASQAPTAETLKKLNARIHEWGDSRTNVRIVDVYNLGNKMTNDEEITILGHTWSAGSKGTLLQKDMLHTTLEGTVAVSLLIASELDVDCIETDPKVIMVNAATNARLDK